MKPDDNLLWRLLQIGIVAKSRSREMSLSAGNKSRVVWGKGIFLNPDQGVVVDFSPLGSLRFAPSSRIVAPYAPGVDPAAGGVVVVVVGRYLTIFIAIGACVCMYVCMQLWWQAGNRGPEGREGDLEIRTG